MNTSWNSRCQNLLLEAVWHGYLVTWKSHNSEFITNTTGRGNGRIRTSVSLHSYSLLGMGHYRSLVPSTRFRLGTRLLGHRLPQCARYDGGPYRPWPRLPWPFIILTGIQSSEGLSQASSYSSGRHYTLWTTDENDTHSSDTVYCMIIATHIHTCTYMYNNCLQVRMNTPKVLL